MKKIKRALKRTIKIIQQRERRRKRMIRGSLAFNTQQLAEAGRFEQQLILMVK